MYRSLLSVGGFTLLSRVTGFIRDIVLGAVLGDGLLSDAFFVAFRLPNHFRTIFGEVAFNSAYVPCYSQVLEQEGPERAHAFSSQIFTILLASQIVLLGLAWLFTPTLIDLLAHGYRADPRKFDAAVTMTRITFPYLLFIVIVTLQSGTLNANGYFAAAAFAPVLLNVTTVVFLGLAFLFPNAGIAASWGTMVSGFLQLLMTGWAAHRAGILEHFAIPEWTDAVRRFFRRLGPAVIGSAGPQIAVFADTMIASYLPTGGLTSLYYADRMYQLPLGVIAIAAGTVLLPEMSRRLAAGDEAGAYVAQNRTIAISLVLAAPFFIAFIMVPEWIMRAAFEHGHFSGAAADQSAAVLEAYGFGLLSIVLIRSVVPSFLARGDTRTPMIVTLISFGFNVLLKILLFKPLGAVGLATATAAGSWLNIGLLVFLAVRRDEMRPDMLLARIAAAVGIASLALALSALALPWIGWLMFGGLTSLAVDLTFGFIAVFGGLVYVAALIGALRGFGVVLPLPARLAGLRARFG
ncbi:putative lipid II flippase MurJ [Beijerinckiaceae bacterium RH AL1]|nr:murein biosynthesis integral membrane protein MurJ [Beijerinckiaceae bacterium]VVB45259.1 putative lipid II flippase MurJ [Beijerinckiaceae bacterium RH CH11]VVB45337.1 putative lipid II flippase MurJ [Beijerinckiaceae bacterium RH AL8]VVC54775.1 putative lipid II flippase MurJ [Beijerinckiaceae bacterium RH AL1]